MATRDENLKKINDELEIMSDEELEQVAGGTHGESYADGVFLYNHGILDDYPSKIGLLLRWGSNSAKIDEGWAKVGITCVSDVFKDNKYFLGDKEISRDEALAIISSENEQIRYDR